MTVIKFPTIGTQVDQIIKIIWDEINKLPDETSCASIISALAIVQFDVTEQMRKKDRP